jgi:hypothetical protein
LASRPEREINDYLLFIQLIANAEQQQRQRG